MYQMTPSYTPEINSANSHEQAPSVISQNSIQMSPYQLHMSQKISPVPCMSVSSKPQNSATLPMPSPMSLYHYQSHMGTPLMNTPYLDSWNASQPGVLPPFMPNDMAYNCNFLGQLQGSYVIDTPEGLDHVNVIIPTLAENEVQYAIVRQVCSDGDALPDKFIHETPIEFTLCSVDGNVEAVLKKGSNMKHTVNWQNYSNGSQTIWRRKAEVTFNLVHVDSLAPSRRNSFSSIDAASTVDSSVCGSTLIDPYGLPMRIRPELLQQSVVEENKPDLMNRPFCKSYTPNDSFENKLRVLEPTNERDEQELAMFELIKAHCMRNASLLKKMVTWAKSNYPARRVSPEEVSTMSEGRLWVTANVAESDESVEIEERLHESLNDIKGAYRQVRELVFKQPEPKVNEPGVQHRLIKSSLGYWKIEANDVNSGKWETCAQELPDGRWQDMKNNGTMIRVQIIPLEKILQRIDKQFMSSDQEVAKSIEFLFTSCNQKKLNSKLKGRNLKHNISNLKIKLEKQYALSFAVQVATTADSIARNLPE